MSLSARQIVSFKEVDKHDTALVGGKGANLGEMTKAHFPVPPGCIITSTAYYNFLKQNNLEQKIAQLIASCNFNHTDSLNQVSKHIQQLILKGSFHDDFISEVFTYYKKLGGKTKELLVAVRSSATAEDLPEASFAGQQETYLNVKGETNLLLKIKEGWASLFTPRAMFYRHEEHFDKKKVGIALVVQKMVESDTSGIMFTLDPVTNDKNKVVVEAIMGLGEYIVGGKVTPDHYEVDKKELEITQKNIHIQDIMLKKIGNKNKKLEIPTSVGKKQKITDNQILELAVLGNKLEQHYYFPQDIEWAIEKKQIYIVQTRAITTTHEHKVQTTAVLLPELLSGSPASPGIASGPVKIIRSAKEINKVQAGDVLVAPETNPDYVPAMKKAKAIVTDHGGRTSHAAIVSRELGIPAVVGADNATKKLKTGMVVTVDGKLGKVYKGSNATSYNSARVHFATSKPTKTKVYVNLAEPEMAGKIATEHVDGVGLLRAEFMMAQIGVHPKKLIHDRKKEEFISQLTAGLLTFCKTFYPRPVVYRASDFKTNEYRNLVGGREFEPVEQNPMLGYRGVYRYITDSEVFNLELEAIKRVRKERDLKNLWLMLPFVRTVDELRKAKKLVTEAGLTRSESFHVWMMAELPANVMLLDKFIDVGIDGISIGSNDLTQLMLGIDRDNDELSTEFDEQNEAVLLAFEHIVKTAKARSIPVSFCGQAVSCYPTLVEKLVTWGITSVSVSPDAINTTRLTIADVERRLKIKQSEL